MPGKNLFIVTALSVVSVVIVGSATSVDVRSDVESGRDGVVATETRVGDRDRSGGDLDETLRLGGRLGGEIVWHRNLPDAIYTSTGISQSAEVVFAGTNLNPPMEVETVPLVGDGTPSWVHGGTHFFVDAARGGDVLAAVDFHPEDSSAVVMEWHPGSSVPLWSYAIRPCRSLVSQGWASGKPLQVSDDGSTIAVAINMYVEGGQRGRLVVFDTGSATPAVDYDLPEGNVVSLAVSDQGEFIAMSGWPNIYVYDRYGQTLRWSGPCNGGNDAIAISGDGTYVAWGWWTFYLRKWTGATYALDWSTSQSGDYLVGECALSMDETTLALAWYHNVSYPDETVVQLYELPSLALLWEHSYADAVRAAGRGDGRGIDTLPREHVDAPSEMVLAPDGSRLVVGSWGGLYPEIQVFERSGPQPLFTVDTPGSIFDVDLVITTAGDAYVSASGKHVHAGQSGRGGDLYSVVVPAEPTDTPAVPAAPGTLRLESVAPNPFSSHATITYWLRDPAPVRVTVHDAQGRLVAGLPASVLSGGHQSATWMGLDSAGIRVASGVYLVRLESNDAVITRKILLLD